MRAAIKQFLIVAVLALSLVPMTVYAQTTTTQTTFASAVSLTATSVNLGSATGVAAGALLFADREEFQVSSISGTVAQVNRGIGGTAVAAHISGAIVYVNPAPGAQPPNGPFIQSDPLAGTCTATSLTWTIFVNVTNGRIWQCTNSQWMNVVDAFVFYPAQWCQGSVSGNSSGTNGYTSLGTAPSIPVVQDSTSATGTNTHYYMCTINPPSRTYAVKSAYIVDVQFYYGVQTTALGTQVATLASGTMNSKTVFTSIGYPVPGAAETATGLAEAARADAGTLVITPVVGSFNVSTTTAGEFYSATFTPATPIAVATDRQQLQLTVSLLNTATSATVTNSPGFIVHYRTLQAGF